MQHSDRTEEALGGALQPQVGNLVLKAGHHVWRLFGPRRVDQIVKSIPIDSA